jgi:hypothetical protein
VTAVDTLLASNAPGNCSGAVTDGHGNLSFPAADVSCPVAFANGDPKLDTTLTNTGGPTLTLALQSGSAAIDAGTTNVPGTDQRGVLRPAGAGPDIGALEVPTPRATTGAASSITTTTATLNGVASNPALTGGTAHFEYGPPANPTQFTTPGTVVAAGSPAAPIAATVSGLAPTTQYEYRLVVTNGEGSATGTSASFTTAAPPPPHTLTVSVTGTGSGTVTGPGGLSCPGTCSASFTAGQTVSLAAHPAAGSTFKEWSGGCAGAGACSIVLSADRSVSARFEKVAPPPPPGKPGVTRLTFRRQRARHARVQLTASATVRANGAATSWEIDRRVVTVDRKRHRKVRWVRLRAGSVSATRSASASAKYTARAGTKLTLEVKARNSAGQVTVGPQTVTLR